MLFSIFDFRFSIERIDLTNRKSQIGNRKSPLNLIDLNFSISLAVSLFALVLLAALLFKDDDLFAASVADDSRFDGSAAADPGVFAFTCDERFKLDFLSFGFADSRHAQGLPFRYGKLFSARSYDRVTHSLYLLRIKAEKASASRKEQIIRKIINVVKLTGGRVVGSH